MNSSSHPAGEESSEEDWTRHLSLGMATDNQFKFKFRIRDGQIYHHTLGQPDLGTSPADSRPGLDLKTSMTQEVRSPPALDSPGLDPKDLTLEINEAKEPRTSEARIIRGQKTKGTQARKGPRPNTSIEWARPHLYTLSYRGPNRGRGQRKRTWKKDSRDGPCSCSSNRPWTG